MARKIEIIGEDVVVTENGNVFSVRINEESAAYQALKAETNNFTENMIQKDKIELLEETQADLIMTLMMNGGI
jgi:hypothetical protein